MKIYKLIILLVFCGAAMSQHRRHFGGGHHDMHGRNNNFRHSHMNHQQFSNEHHHREQPFQFVPSVQHELPRISSSFCPQIEFVKQMDNRWYGTFKYNSIREQKGVSVELDFNQQILVFGNDFSHSNSLDNKLFTIKNDSKILKRGEVLQFNFFVSYDESTPLPIITRVKVNNIQLCPDEISSKECAELEILSKERGSWEGILTIFPHQYSMGRRIDLLFDGNLLALVNDVGDSLTNDQGHFMITNQKNTARKGAITINLRVKYKIFDKSPTLEQVYVDGMLICLSKDTDMNRSGLQSTTSSPYTRAINTLKLENLPFHLLPNTTSIPENIQNDGYECGSSMSSLTFRVENGDIAHSGQFPFHTAVYYNSAYRCAASLISEKVTLSAAHCVVNSQKEILPIENFHLLFGSVDLESLTGNERLRKVSKIMRHPNYRHEKILREDIAIMVTNGSLQFSDFVRPICLSELLPPINKRIGRDMTVLGFGSSIDSLEPSRYLHYGKMSIISRDECTENIIFALLPEDSTFCAKSNESSLCPGDSGGGIIETINDKYYLRGIASVTVTGPDGKCKIEESVGFTDIKAFLPWIRENINKLE